MATSGTRTFSLDVATAIEEAYELAGLEARTSYDAVTARRSMNIMFADWSNRGVQMWEISKVELTLTEGDNDYSINAYDIDILDAYIQRTVNDIVTDYPLDRIDRNEFIGIPTKATKARPTEFWLERLKTPVIHLYPTPENSTDKLIYYVWQRIQDSSASINDVDIPSRFIPPLVSGLAYYLCLKKNIQKLGVIKEQYEQDLMNALKYDEDRSSTRLVPRHEYV
ncbi:MAG: hypothetical protein CMC15_13075 [Flavobacteriaceae bacterium]|jgi:hypothetical protein|nr:hypothetical protein [Flavobacteriaceae bacterium]|tara:strand:- start:1953 stop:2624 length:672 start_codon:yes stop_codon:yes gene_type:complete